MHLSVSNVAFRVGYEILREDLEDSEKSSRRTLHPRPADLVSYLHSKPIGEAGGDFHHVLGRGR